MEAATHVEKTGDIGQKVRKMDGHCGSVSHGQVCLPMGPPSQLCRSSCRAFRWSLEELASGRPCSFTALTKPAKALWECPGKLALNVRRCSSLAFLLEDSMVTKGFRTVDTYGSEPLYIYVYIYTHISTYFDILHLSACSNASGLHVVICKRRSWASTSISKADCSYISSGRDSKQEFGAPCSVYSLACVASAASGRGQQVFRTKVMRYHEAHEHAESCQDRNEYGIRRLLTRYRACHGGVIHRIETWSCTIIMTFCFCKKICIHIENSYNIYIYISICEARHM